FYNPRTGDTVTQLSTTPHQSYQGVVGDNGSLKLSQLTEGTYRWKEVAAAEGYQLGQVYWPNENGFLVNYSESLKENAFTYTATNKKLYQLELTKTDSDTKQPLNAVPFIISKTENDKQSYLKVNADSTGFEWTEVEAEAKQFLTGKSYLLGQDGHVAEQTGDAGKLIVKYFPDAPNLTWKEVSVPTGYSSKGTLTGKFVPTADNTYAYTASQKNTRLYQVTLEKKASDTNEGLKDAVFALQRKDGNQWVEVTYDGKSEFTTNSEGKISIPNLEAGTYRWEEKKAPTGYKSDQQYYPKEEGFEVAYHDGLTIDSSNQNYLFEATTAKNSPRDFELVLEKLSSTFNRPIGEVEFKLYSNLNGTTFSDEMTTLKTNSEGKIVFGSDLIKADKTYYLVETKAADGFIALKGYFKVVTSKTDGIKVSYVKSDGETDASPFEFSTADGNIYKGNLKVYNKRKSILPITGGNGILQYITIGAGMILFATLFFLLKRKALKWFLVLAIATTGFAGLGSHANKVFADEQDKVTLEINRLIYQPSDTQFKSGTPVEGAELEVFDVTDTFYDFVTNDKLSRQAAQEKLSKSTDLKGKSLAKAETDNLGKASFTVAKTSNQQVAVYLIKETVTPVAVTPMEPLVVVLPIVDEQGNEKEFVSLYPKSHGTFTFDKSIDDKQDSYNLGEAIPYRLSTVIPQDIVSLVTYEIEDVYDQGLNFIPESLAILVDGKKQSELIKTVTPSENQFRVSFDVAQLARFAGKKIEVTYNMVIKDSASIDQPLVNTATLYPGNLTPLVDKEEVITGGFRFIKLGASGGNTPLANAKFVIKKPEDNAVLTHKDGHYQFEKVETDAAGVVQLTSDAKGNFEIKGLRYGEYLVCEIQAPSGYVLNDKPTTFTIRANSYKDGPALTIYNTEKPKVNLPKTGVVETSIALVGLFILASSLMMIRRKKEN
ncbi:MAG: SpaH/EbpB family LPXTG-anchored major pilin, partial [Streptococcus orisratti]|uniref:SpaH/EbpB family LPXTG-anchored major pilin n=1 Tax=Streptococcus orisratti TaxID=114652 RepID=UPI002A91BAE5